LIASPGMTMQLDKRGNKGGIVLLEVIVALTILSFSILSTIAKTFR